MLSRYNSSFGESGHSLLSNTQMYRERLRAGLVRNAQGMGSEETPGFQVVLAEIVSAAVVIFMWMNSLGKDQEAITHTGDICVVMQLHRARGPRGIRSSGVTSYVSAITECHPLSWS